MPLFQILVFCFFFRLVWFDFFSSLFQYPLRLINFLLLTVLDWQFLLSSVSKPFESLLKSIYSYSILRKDRSTLWDSLTIVYRVCSFSAVQYSTVWPHYCLFILLLMSIWVIYTLRSLEKVFLQICSYVICCISVECIPRSRMAGS